MPPSFLYLPWQMQVRGIDQTPVGRVHCRNPETSIIWHFKNTQGPNDQTLSNLVFGLPSNENKLWGLSLGEYSSK